MRPLHSSKKKNDRGKSYAPSNVKGAMKGTTVGKFREKTLGLR